MKLNLITIAIVGLLAVAHVGAAQDSEPKPENVNPIIMRVNGDPVYAAEVSLLMQNIQGFLASQGRQATQEEIFQVASQRIVEQKLLAQEAGRFGLQPDDDEVQRMLEMSERQAGGREALAQSLAAGGSSLEQLESMIREMDLGRVFIQKQIQPTIQATDEEVATFYNEHLDQFTTDEMVHARHILIEVASDADAETDAAARAKADAARERALAGEDFAELAKELSEGPSGPSGGDLGFFEKGRMVQPFDEAVFALEVGEISPVVQTSFGYHVITVVEKRPAGTLSLEEATPRARAMLVTQKTNMTTAELIQTLGQKADLVFYDENGSPITDAQQQTETDPTE
jgi:parvulin-like peptidyl-prolyl isomerase